MLLHINRFLHFLFYFLFNLVMLFFILMMVMILLLICIFFLLFFLFDIDLFFMNRWFIIFTLNFLLFVLFWWVIKVTIGTLFTKALHEELTIFAILPQMHKRTLFFLTGTTLEIPTHFTPIHNSKRL